MKHENQGRGWSAERLSHNKLELEALETPAGRPPPIEDSIKFLIF